MKSINGSKFSTIPSTLSIDCTYAAKARLTNMSVLLVTNTPSSRIMSISGCYTCIWTNVEHFMRSTKCYQGIYVVDTRQLLCKAWTHISRLCMTGLSSCQEKAFPSKKKKKHSIFVEMFSSPQRKRKIQTSEPSLWHMTTSQPRTDLSVFHRLHGMCLFP